jgi:hypothetical protein
MVSMNRSREGEVLAPAMYAAKDVEIQADGSVLILGKPLRGEMHLISCYTPPWWYVMCSTLGCNFVGGRGPDPSRPSFMEDALSHRCSS